MIKKYALGIAAIIAATSCSNGPKDKYTDTATTGVVEISADESFAPIIAQQAEVFENIYTMAGIIPLNTSEKEAISLLLTDSVRLAITTRMLPHRTPIARRQEILSEGNKNSHRCDSPYRQPGKPRHAHKHTRT